MAAQLSFSDAGIFAKRSESIHPQSCRAKRVFRDFWITCLGNSLKYVLHLEFQ